MVKIKYIILTFLEFDFEILCFVFPNYLEPGKTLENPKNTIQWTQSYSS